MAWANLLVWTGSRRGGRGRDAARWEPHPRFEALEPRLLLDAVLPGFDPADHEQAQTTDMTPALLIADAPSAGIVQQDGRFMRQAGTGAAVLNVAELEAALGAGPVSVSTAFADGAAGGDAADLVIAADVSWASDVALMLRAGRDIVFAQGVAVSNSGGGGLTLRADKLADGQGTVVFEAGAALAFDAGGVVEVLYNPAGGYGQPVDYGAWVSAPAGDDLRAMMLVNNVDDLQAMQANLAGNYALGADIDASTTANWHAGAGFAPIGDADTPFTGTLDGRGHVIAGLTIDRPQAAFAGLFGALAGQANVAELILDGGSVVGRGSPMWQFGEGGVGMLAGWMGGQASLTAIDTRGDVTGEGWYVGGLVGWMRDSASVTDSQTSGSVTGNSRIGGLVGEMVDDASVTASHASGDVSGESRVGGLVGLLIHNASVSDSHASGAVSGDQYLGGLIGAMWHDASVTASHAGGDVSGNTQVGGLVGAMWQSASIIDSHAIGDVNGSSSIGGLVGEMRLYTLVTASQASGNVSGNASVGGLVGAMWSFASVSDAHAGGDVSGTRQVGGLVGEMDWHASVVASHASGAVSGAVSHSWQVGGLVGRMQDFAAVGDSQASGAVSGSLSVGGLVGSMLNHASVSDSHAGGDVSGNQSVGGLVGDMRNHASVIDSHASGDLTGEGWEVGGLVGWMSNAASITASHASGAVSGNSRVGGLVGSMSNAASVSDSQAGGDVSGSSSVGGLVGAMWSFASVSDSHAGGDVSGYSRVGGLVGEMWSFASVSDSQANGLVSGNSSVGGLVGVMHDDASVSRSHASGAVSAQRRVGGLVGALWDASSVTASHASGVVSGNASVGGLVGEMWDFASVSDSQANGLVSGNSSVGGLVGDMRMYASVTASHASGGVSGDQYVGGLVGLMISDASVTASQARGDVSGNASVGGLVGAMSDRASVTASHANGDVSGSSSVGGLVGLMWVDSSIIDAYALGDVSGAEGVGGIVGRMGRAHTVVHNIVIERAYAAGAVSATGSQPGGLIGIIEDVKADGRVTASFFNIDTAGTSSAVGQVTDSPEVVIDVMGLTTGQMQQLGHFQAAGWDFDQTWAILPGVTCPYFTWSNPPVLVGDMNLDGVVDTGDVATFVLALTHPASYMSQFGVDEATLKALGDINGDGVLDTGDVAPFVQLLVGSNVAETQPQESVASTDRSVVEASDIGDKAEVVVAGSGNEGGDEWANQIHEDGVIVAAYEELAEPSDEGSSSVAVRADLTHVLSRGADEPARTQRDPIPEPVHARVVAVDNAHGDRLLAEEPAEALVSAKDEAFKTSNGQDDEFDVLAAAGSEATPSGPASTTTLNHPHYNPSIVQAMMALWRGHHGTTGQAGAWAMDEDEEEPTVAAI